MMASHGQCRLMICLVAMVVGIEVIGPYDTVARSDDRLTVSFEADVLPLIRQHCISCHSSEEKAGELDLQQFATVGDAKAQPAIWEHVAAQVSDGEMPPKQQTPLDRSKQDRLLAWIQRMLDQVALESAGDPGPIALRRLSNAEYTYSIHDLTGVATLDPVREFPRDGAAGEGFTNASAALVMSPTLVSKYLDAAKEVSRHAVFLPTGIEFSPSTSASDWANEKLSAIRNFYANYTQAQGATAVNLQGIQFETNQGGRLPLPAYLDTLNRFRIELAESKVSTTQLAAQQGLNAKYLDLLYQTLQSSDGSLLISDLKEKYAEGTLRYDDIRRWQDALWRFTSVGHIGKVNGPQRWQEPVDPLVDSQTIRLPLGTADDTADRTIYFTVGDAGDGSEHDVLLWENPRLVISGRGDLALRDLRSTWHKMVRSRAAIVAQTEDYLDAVDAVLRASDEVVNVEDLASKRRLNSAALANWLDTVGVHVGRNVVFDHLIRGRLESTPDYSFVKGWVGDNALGVLANSSDADVRVPGLLRAHSVAAHPAPDVAVLVAWRSPVDSTVTVSGQLFDAHTDCGNGFQWDLEIRRGRSIRRLAGGISNGADPISLGPFPNLRVDQGDAIVLAIGPRDGNHICDLTAIDLAIHSDTQTWNLANDVSPAILSGNPHADSYQNPEVWYFAGQPLAGPAASRIPPDSLLARWLAAESGGQRSRLASDLHRLLVEPDDDLQADSPDRMLRRLLLAFDGPLMTQAIDHAAEVEPISSEALYGLSEDRFGRHPDQGDVAPNSLCVAAPTTIPVNIPAELAAISELVVTAKLHPSNQGRGSAEVQVTTEPPDSPLHSTARRIASGPIIVDPDGVARQRFVQAFDDFRQWFPLALCYTTIVPVDEVVTLTLYYREDDHLKRLMLSDAEVAQIDRLWEELLTISEAPLKLVDAFEQLYQYATQDADPSAFEPLRAPILAAAEAFRIQRAASQRSHIEAVIEFAGRAWRRPLAQHEQDGLVALYERLKQQDLAHEAALRTLITRVLMAPAFIYRGEQTLAGNQPTAIDGHELATRLSYFLWSSVPDAELTHLASTGELSNPAVLAAQVQRMTRDPKIRRWATEFGCQWLQIRDLATLDEKSERHFPTFVTVREDMLEEAVQFLIDLAENDGSILSLLDADHSFVNERLADHYQIPFAATGWQRVEGMRDLGRGGMLGFAATLAKQSGASRTSPILRGNWISETVLGERLPRPPKDVPVLPDEAPAGLTERQLIERHSSDNACRSCHQRIDPYGFALEGFDAIGRRRQQDSAGNAIDTHSELADGTPLNGLGGVRSYLLDQRRDDFVRQFCRKLIGYALGRSVLLSDRPLVDAMVQRLKDNDYRVHIAFEMVVTSPQFTHVRGQDFVAQ